jgi:hypothetical protein
MGLELRLAASRDLELVEGPAIKAVIPRSQPRSLLMSGRTSRSNELGA